MPFVTQALPSLPQHRRGGPGKAVPSLKSRSNRGKVSPPAPVPPEHELCGRERRQCPFLGSPLPLAKVKPSPHRCVPSRFSPRGVNPIPLERAAGRFHVFPSGAVRQEGVPQTRWEFIQAPRVPGAARGQVLVATRSFGLRLGCGRAPSSSQPSRAPKAGREGAGEASRAGAEADAGTGPGRHRDRDRDRDRDRHRDRDRDRDRTATLRHSRSPARLHSAHPRRRSPPGGPARRCGPWAAPRVTALCDVTRPRAVAAAMGKSRSGAAKAGSVFRIARSGVLRAKAKGKARPVTSGLKQINIKNAEKVSTINKAFAEVQKEIRQLSKGTSAEPQNTQQVSTNLEEEPANVDAATSLLSQL
ncbi:ribosomal biogenesis factor [Anomalospiza imberbis]|uniref:ribosomal biogenesis factor n=1 Tax=Anomalospiza imberbis TaxID=187417 RepID=UPI00358EB2E9